VCIDAALRVRTSSLRSLGLLERFRRIELVADEIDWHEIAV